ncbi:MAG: T9SS type A sorting domain-containing protein [Bacteroidota bacterium]
MAEAQHLSVDPWVKVFSGKAREGKNGVGLYKALNPPATPPAFTAPFPKTQTTADWDTAFAFDAAQQVPSGDLLAVTWTGQEFWISGFATNMIFRFDSQGTKVGEFFVNQAEFISGLTYDGNHVWAIDSNRVVYQFDPQNYAVLRKDTLVLPLKPSFITFDPSLNNQNGGFHIGLWGEYQPIFQYDTNWLQLGHIPAATHGRMLIFGAVYDDLHPAGPILWTLGFEPASRIFLTQLDLNNGGIPTGVSREVNLDFAQITTPTHLGINLFFMKDYLGQDQHVLGGMAQNGPDGDIIFGYKMDYQFVLVDARVQGSRPQPGFANMPLSQAQPITINGFLNNRGFQDLDSVKATLEVINQATHQAIFSQSQTYSSLASNQSVAYQLGPWTPSEEGVFHIKTRVETPGLIDEVEENNQEIFQLVIGDSSLQRHRGTANGQVSVNLGPNKGSVLGQLFENPQLGLMTSISFELLQPTEGDVVFASMYAWSDSLSLPIGNPIVSTKPYTITAADASQGLSMPLRFPLDPTPVPTGKYLIAVHENGGPVTLATTAHIYTPQTTFLYSEAPAVGSQWLDLAQQFSPPLEASLILYPNFGPCIPTYMQGTITVDNDDGSGQASATVSVSGASGEYSYQWDDPLAQTGPTATELAGGQVYACTIEDTAGCRLILQTDTLVSWATSLEEEEKIGLAALKLYPNPARDHLQVEIDWAVIPRGFSLALYSQAGQLVDRVEIKELGLNKAQLKLADHPRGMYLLKVETALGMVYRKVWLK